jgi:hypothetical protein
MITWHTIQADTGHMEIVEAFDGLEEALAEMRLLAWEEPSNRYADYLLDQNTGEAVVVAIFGPEQELLVTCADGRRLSFPMPDSYRQ